MRPTKLFCVGLIKSYKHSAKNRCTMPIRNLWSLETGEVVTAEAILINVKGAEVFFPLRDVGTDLLVVEGKNHVSVQVKESRYFTSRVLKGTRGHSWHQINRKKLDREKVDFYVFLTYYQTGGEHSPSPFEYKFVIVPTSDLEKRIREAEKKSGKKGFFSFYFNFDGKKVVEKRDVPTDYSDYLDRWDLIKDALDGTISRNIDEA